MQKGFQLFTANEIVNRAKTCLARSTRDDDRRTTTNPGNVQLLFAILVQLAQAHFADPRCLDARKQAFLPENARKQMERAGAGAPERDSASSNDPLDDRFRKAETKVRLNEISQARQCLTGAPLAPRTEATFEELQSKRPREVLGELPGALRNREGRQALRLDRQKFADCLRSAPKGSSPGPGGMSYEFLKIALDDESLLDLLGDAAEALARADIPEEIGEAFMLARLTALCKPAGGVRAIATGTPFRRLVGRSLARQFASEMESACAPHQYTFDPRRY